MNNYYVMGIEEADMKKIRGFRLKLVSFLFPALTEVLERVARAKVTALQNYHREISKRKKLELEISILRDIQEERLRISQIEIKKQNNSNEVERSSEVSGN